MKKFLKIAAVVIVAVIFVGTFVYLYQKSQTKPTVYEVETPKYADIKRTTVLTGSIEPRDKVEIKPQINGIISEIIKEAGDEVKNGGTSNDDQKRQEKVLRGIKSWLSNIEKKRNACAEIEIGDLRRRFTLISQMNDPIGSFGGNLLKQLQLLYLKVSSQQSI